MTATAADLAQMLAESRHAVVLTGAGISTESGIPDFRSPGGTWEVHDPTVVASLSTFLTDPSRFWHFHRPRIDMLRAVEPNGAHRAVAELERRGIVQAVITQNIDRLHQRAGSTQVIEVHGSIRAGHCLRCDAQVALDDMLELADAAADGVPLCDCGFALKSTVVQFGEPLPAEAIGTAFAHAEEADMMLVIGSSLQVTPVADLPQVVRSNGGRLAILTEGETPYDRQADLRLHGRAGAELAATLEALEGLGAP